MHKTTFKVSHKLILKAQLSNVDILKEFFQRTLRDKGKQVFHKGEKLAVTLAPQFRRGLKQDGH
jgi:hypothetical protein